MPRLSRLGGSIRSQMYLLRRTGFESETASNLCSSLLVGEKLKYSYAHRRVIQMAGIGKAVSGKA